MTSLHEAKQGCAASKTTEREWPVNEMYQISFSPFDFHSSLYFPSSSKALAHRTLLNCPASLSSLSMLLRSIATSYCRLRLLHFLHSVNKKEAGTILLAPASIWTGLLDL